MPAPGDQHSIVVNPFEDAKPRVSEFTAQEIATLQSRLEKQLGPEYLSSRAGPSGQKVHYITADKCIALANDVFGFNGWSSSIQNIQIDFCEENPQTHKVCLGLSVIVRVTLKDGTFHEDIGYGHIENCKTKAQAFEKAKKEGTTDGLKRALRNFGNVLGNCLYDKAYIAKVTKMKVEPTKFHEGGLHRHADFASKEEVKAKVEDPLANSTGDHTPSTAFARADSYEDFLGELDEADFCVAEEGHPDEVVAPESQHTTPAVLVQKPNTVPMQPPSRPLARSTSAGSSFGRAPQTPNQSHLRAGVGAAQQNQNGQRPQQPHQQSHQHQQGHHGKPPMQHQQQHQRPPPPQQQNSNAGQRHHPSAPIPRPLPQHQQLGSLQNQPPAPPTGAEPVAFFSARAVPKTSEGDQAPALPTPQPNLLFNPRAESPSIRKTPGIDHTTTKPLSRTGQHVPGTQPAESDKPAAAGAAANRPPQQQQPPQPRNVMNPHLDSARRIGAPGGAGSSLANRGQYRPPTMTKRPAPADGVAGRTPLNEVPGNVPLGGAGNAMDAAKRLRTG